MSSVTEGGGTVTVCDTCGPAGGPGTLDTGIVTFITPGDIITNSRYQLANNETIMNTIHYTYSH